MADIKKQELKYLLLATLVAPLAIYPATLLGEFVVFVFSPVGAAEMFQRLKESMLITTAALVYAYALTIFYGLPVFLLLRKLQRLKLRFILAAGVVAAVAVSLITEDSVVPILLFAYFGLVVSFTGWFVAIHMQQSRLASERAG